MTSHVYPLKCRIRAEAGTTRVDVYDDIGGGGGWMSGGVSAADFAAQLAPVKGALEVHINSAGGDVFDGIAISSAIRAHKGRVTTVVDGLAASIASVIAQAGQERVVQPGGMLMIHDAFGLCVGDAAEMTEMASTLDKVSDNIASVYAGRSGRMQDYWRQQMRAETWYTADEAVAVGLADKVGDGDAALPAGLDLAALGSVPGRIAARLRSMPQAADGDDSGGGACPTCDGKKTIRHQSGKFSQCPDCKGTGTAPDPDSDAGDSDDIEGAASDAPGDAPDCPTCDGSGKILEGHRTCPDCHGTGKKTAAQDRAERHLARYGRVLGAESMPLRNEAIPVHHTATVDTPWDGPAAVAGMPNDANVLKYCHAWQDTASDDGSVADDPDGDADDRKSSYKFPHHTTKGGPANLAACRNGLARLSSASIPSGDDAGVQAHLNAHLKDGGGHPGGDDHAHLDLSGVDLAEVANALKGALA